jgi:hypothetical protein
MSGKSYVWRTAAILVVVGHVILFASRSLPFFSIPRQSQQRQLSTNESRTCSLSEETLRFQFHEWTKTYRLVSDGTTADERWKWTVDNSFNQSVANKGTNISNKNETDRLLQAENSNNTTTSPMTLRSFSQTNGAIIEVRACWCAEAYLDRPIEYCPASFDTCLVRGEEGLVSCYTSTGSHGFMSSFWPLASFWIVALGYALSCTDGGTWARQFIRRILAHPSEGQVMLEENLDQLLEDRPEHAVFLYRQAVMRIRQAYLEPRRRREWFSTSSDSDGSHATPDEGDFLEAPRDTLILKVTTYGEPSFNVQRTPSVARNSTTSWRHDQVTFQQMDSQMEQGLRCAICLVRLEQGDVVGNIPCGHVFHKACLKSWLPQANRCPLCRHPDIATLRTRRPTAQQTSVSELSIAQIY